MMKSTSGREDLSAYRTATCRASSPWSCHGRKSSRVKPHPTALPIQETSCSQLHQYMGPIAICLVALQNQVPEAQEEREQLVSLSTNS